MSHNQMKWEEWSSTQQNITFPITYPLNSLDSRFVISYIHADVKQVTFNCNLNKLFIQTIHLNNLSQCSEQGIAYFGEGSLGARRITYYIAAFFTKCFMGDVKIYGYQE